MTVTEKAANLIMKFSVQLPYYTQKDNMRKSVICALICVEEILEHCKELPIGGIYEGTKDYYLKVKEELLKL